MRSTVAAPTHPLILATSPSHYHCSEYAWLYPFTKPTPGGLLHVSNAIVDLDGRIGAWSEPTVLTVESGWRLWGGAWNQPIVEDAAGIAWKVKIVEMNSDDDFQYNPYTAGTEHYLYSGWQGSYPPNEIAPYSSHCPHLEQLTQDAYRLYSLTKFKQGGRNTWVAPAPVVMVNSVPMGPMDFAWCRVAETGETALSPAVHLPSPTFPNGVTLSRSRWVEFRLPEFHPQGTVGYHLYCRGEDETTWRRVPSPECYSTPSTPDDWLFPWWLRQIKILRSALRTYPIHSLAANPQSNLTSLQVRLRDEVGDVVVDPGEVFNVTCPVIDEYGEEGTGTIGGGKHKFGRKIRAADWGKWEIIQHPGAGGHRSWPVVGVFNSYSRWYGAKIQAYGGDALATSDYSGGQSIGNQFHECEFRAQAYPSGNVACGVRIDARSTVNWSGHTDHTASELLFRDCEFSGSVPLWIAGNQTANIRFERMHASAYGYNTQSSLAYIECPNPIKFTGGIYADAYLVNQPQTNQRGVIFRCSTYHASLQIDDIWIDQAFVRFVEANGVSVQLKLTGGKLNVRGSKPLLGLFVNQHAKSTWLMQDVQTQHDGGTYGPYVVNYGYREAEVLLERTGLLSTILREPTEAQANEMFSNIWGTGAMIQPRDKPGYKVPIGGYTTIFNSLTTGETVKSETISGPVAD